MTASQRYLHAPRELHYVSLSRSRPYLCYIGPVLLCLRECAESCPMVRVSDVFLSVRVRVRVA